MPPFKTGPKHTDVPYTALSGTSAIFRFSKMLNNNTIYYLRNLSYKNNPAADKLGVFDVESTLKNFALLRRKNTRTGIGNPVIIHIFAR